VVANHAHTESNNQTSAGVFWSALGRKSDQSRISRVRTHNPKGFRAISWWLSAERHHRKKSILEKSIPEECQKSERLPGLFVRIKLWACGVAVRTQLETLYV